MTDAFLSVSVVMPVYNERDTVEEMAARVLAQPMVSELVLVDDASTDGTFEKISALAADPRVVVSRHPVNRGKGAALRTGFSLATREVVIVQDADREYDPAEYPRLLEPVFSGWADVVFGSRFLGAGSHRVLYYWHSVANRVLTTLSNMGTNLNLTDMECCYKVFRREVLQQIRLREERFGIEPEITAKVARLKVRIYEVPVSYHGRTFAEGKKIRLKDGFRALWCILRYNLVRD